VLTVKECNGDWCEVTAKDLEGWVAQAEIWGAYPGEAFK
jgi:SH3-like domain-containing protein